VKFLSDRSIRTERVRKKKGERRGEREDAAFRFVPGRLASTGREGRVRPVLPATRKGGEEREKRGGGARTRVGTPTREGAGKNFQRRRITLSCLFLLSVITEREKKECQAEKSNGEERARFASGRPHNREKREKKKGEKEESTGAQSIAKKKTFGQSLLTILQRRVPEKERGEIAFQSGEEGRRAHIVRDLIQVHE